MNWFIRFLRRYGWKGPYSVMGFIMGEVRTHSFLTLSQALRHREVTSSMSAFAIHDHWGRRIWSRGEIWSAGYGSQELEWKGN